MCYLVISLFQIVCTTSIEASTQKRKNLTWHHNDWIWSCKACITKYPTILWFVTSSLSRISELNVQTISSILWSVTVRQVILAIKIKILAFCILGNWRQVKHDLQSWLASTRLHNAYWFKLPLKHPTQLISKHLHSWSVSTSPLAGLNTGIDKLKQQF
jgi:hypothetical protein